MVNLRFGGPESAPFQSRFVGDLDGERRRNYPSELGWGRMTLQLICTSEPVSGTSTDHAGRSRRISLPTTHTHLPTVDDCSATAGVRAWRLVACYDSPCHM